MTKIALILFTIILIPGSARGAMFIILTWIISFSSIAVADNGVTVSIDKPGYRMDEVASVTVKNNLETSIWVTKCAHFLFPALEKLVDGKWISIDLHPTRQIACQRSTRSIESKEMVLYKIDLSRLLKLSPSPAYTPGTYRFGTLFFLEDISEKYDGSRRADFSYTEPFQVGAIDKPVSNNTGVDNGVSVLLDKVSYLMDEVVTVTVKNNRKTPIWVTNHNCHFYPELQTFAERKWQIVDFYPTKQRKCGRNPRSIKPNETVIYKREHAKLLKLDPLPAYTPGIFRYMFVFYLDNVMERLDATHRSNVSYSKQFAMEKPHFLAWWKKHFQSLYVGMPRLAAEKEIERIRSVLSTYDLYAMDTSETVTYKLDDKTSLLVKYKPGIPAMHTTGGVPGHPPQDGSLLRYSVISNR